MQNIKLHCRSFIKELPPVRILKLKKKKKALLSQKKLKNALDKFVGKTLSQNEYQKLTADMIEKTQKYGFSFEEYFLLGLNGKSDKEIHEYISDFERIHITERLNKARNQAIFDDKGLTYKYFHQFYHRACLMVEPTQTGIQKLRTFADEHGSFIFKPVETAGGAGIEVVRDGDTAGLEKTVNKLLKRCKYGAFIEELITQIPEMSMLHPQSINSVRIPTIRVSNQETVLFHPFLRVGRGNSIVDNASSGGIICALDPESGTVVAAADELGGKYENHPDTGVQLIGFQIPRWPEAVECAKKLAEVIPSNRYTGWDLALTEQGWVMIEANARGQFVWQYATQEGCRSELNSLFQKMGMKHC